MDEEVRVTTQAEVFDDHFESHEFLSPGGRLFEQLVFDESERVRARCRRDKRDGLDGLGPLNRLVPIFRPPRRSDCPL